MQLLRHQTVVPEAFPIGQPITLVPEEAPDWPQELEGYPSRIEDVTDGAVVVSMPMKQRRLVELPKNVPVSAYFNRRGSRYRFRGVVGTTTQSPFPVLHIMRVGAVANVDRRAHARVELAVQPVELSVRDPAASEQPAPEPINPRHSLVVNLGGGGLGLVCRDAIRVGSTVGITLDLPGEFGRLEVEGELLRSVQTGSEGLKKWQMGVKFRSLSSKDQDRIAAFVLYRQRMNRQKGLG